MEKTGIVIRCMYNNQGWKAPCIKLGEDPECKPCFYPLVQIRPPKQDDKICSGHCWERYICTDYRWGCYPKGNTFARAYKGMEVFFVYKHLAGDYTIWGATRAVSIDSEPMQTGKDFEDGYKFIHFEPFEQLPKEEWVSGLSDKQLVGTEWRQGRFRYIDREQELHLEKLIKGETSEITQGGAITTPPSGTSILNEDIIDLLRKYKLLPKRYRGREVAIEFENEAEFQPVDAELAEAINVEVGASIRDYLELANKEHFYVYAENDMAEEVLTIPKGARVRAHAITLFGIKRDVDWGEDGPIDRPEECTGLLLKKIVQVDRQ